MEKSHIYIWSCWFCFVCSFFKFCRDGVNGSLEAERIQKQASCPVDASGSGNVGSAYSLWASSSPLNPKKVLRVVTRLEF